MQSDRHREMNPPRPAFSCGKRWLCFFAVHAGGRGRPLGPRDPRRARTSSGGRAPAGAAAGRGSTPRRPPHRDRAGEWIALDFRPRGKSRRRRRRASPKRWAVTRNTSGKTSSTTRRGGPRGPRQAPGAEPRGARRAAGARVIVTSRADSAATDFVSRFSRRAPGCPRTGDGLGHCAARTFWQARLGQARSSPPIRLAAAASCGFASPATGASSAARRSRPPRRAAIPVRRIRRGLWCARGVKTHRSFVIAGLV